MFVLVIMNIEGYNIGYNNILADGRERLAGLYNPTAAIWCAANTLHSAIFLPSSKKKKAFWQIFFPLMYGHPLIYWTAFNEQGSH